MKTFLPSPSFWADYSVLFLQLSGSALTDLVGLVLLSIGKGDTGKYIYLKWNKQQSKKVTGDSVENCVCMWVCMCVFKWTPIQTELNRELNPCNTYLFGSILMFAENPYQNLMTLKVDIDFPFSSDNISFAILTCQKWMFA